MEYFYYSNEAYDTIIGGLLLSHKAHAVWCITVADCGGGGGWLPTLSKRLFGNGAC